MIGVYLVEWMNVGNDITPLAHAIVRADDKVSKGRVEVLTRSDARASWRD